MQLHTNAGQMVTYSRKPNSDGEQQYIYYYPQLPYRYISVAEN